MNSPTDSLDGAVTDWWYVRAYPGHPDLMDEATRVLVPWLAARAAEEGAPAWFFTRYWDMSGHHLRPAPSRLPTGWCGPGSRPAARTRRASPLTGRPRIRF